MNSPSLIDFFPAGEPPIENYSPLFPQQNLEESKKQWIESWENESGFKIFQLVTKDGVVSEYKSLPDNAVQDNVYIPHLLFDNNIIVRQYPVQQEQTLTGQKRSSDQISSSSISSFNPNDFLL